MQDDTAYLSSAEMMGRMAGSAGCLAARAFIADRFAAYGLLPAGTDDYYQPFLSPYGDTANVVAYLPGQDAALAREVIVIGAHYDHLGVIDGQIYFGAHDDAAGVASLLEIARAAASLGARLRRTLVFIAFDAEEQGLLGSRHYVQQPAFPPIENTIYMINLDQIGYLNVAEALYAPWAGSLAAR